MKWYRLKRRIRLKPNLIDPYRSISYREARRIWRTEGRPGALEILEGARKKAGKTPEEWEALTGLKQKQTYRTPGAAVRRWAFACVFVLLVSAFLAFTAPGRAFAAKVYRTFTTIAENIFIRKEENPSVSYLEPRSEYDDGNSVKMESLQNAYESIGKPFLYFPDKQYSLTSIETVKNQSGTILITQYTKGDVLIHLIHRWPQKGQENKLVIQRLDEQYYSTYTSSGLLIEGIYAEDHTYQGGTVGDDFIIKVILEQVTNASEIESIVNPITFYPSLK